MKQSERALGLLELFASRLAVECGRVRVDAEEHVGLKQTNGVGEVRADVATGHDDGDAVLRDHVRQDVGLFDVSVGDTCAENGSGDDGASHQEHLRLQLHEDLGAKLGESIGFKGWQIPPGWIPTVVSVARDVLVTDRRC